MTWYEITQSVKQLESYLRSSDLVAPAHTPRPDGAKPSEQVVLRMGFDLGGPFGPLWIEPTIGEALVAVCVGEICQHGPKLYSVSISTCDGMCFLTGKTLDQLHKHCDRVISKHKAAAQRQIAQLDKV